MSKTNNKTAATPVQTGAASKINNTTYNTGAVHGATPAATSRTPVRLELSKIKTDDIQVRVKLDRRVVDEFAELMQDNIPFPPVVVFRAGTDYILADGYHRVAAASKNEFRDIDAEVREGTRLDALWHALGANRTHGLRLGRGDVKKAVEIGLKTWPEKSQAEIAAQIGTSQSYVSEIKSAGDNIGTDIIPSSRTDSLGRTRPTTYTKADIATTEDAPIDAGHDDAGESTAPATERVTSAVGVQVATQAVGLLKSIPDDDTERMQAIAMVSIWLSEVMKPNGSVDSVEGQVSA